MAVWERRVKRAVQRGDADTAVRVATTRAADVIDATIEGLQALRKALETDDPDLVLDVIRVVGNSLSELHAPLAVLAEVHHATLGTKLPNAPLPSAERSELQAEANIRNFGYDKALDRYWTGLMQRSEVVEAVLLDLGDAASDLLTAGIFMRGKAARDYRELVVEAVDTLRPSIEYFLAAVEVLEEEDE